MSQVVGGLRERYDRAYGDRELVRRIVRRFRPERRRMALVAALIVCHSALTVTRPLLIARSIDVALARPAPGSILALAAAILASGLLSWGVEYARKRAARRATGNVVLQLRLDTFKAVIGHDMSFYDENATPRIVSRVTEDAQDVAQAVSLTTSLIGQVLLIAVFSAVLVTIDWKLTLVVLAIAPFVIWIARTLRAVSRPVAVQEKRMRGTVAASVGESIGGIAVAKGFRQEDTLYGEFQRVNEQAYRVGLKRGLVLESVFPALYALRAVATTAILYAGGVSAVRGEISAGTWYLFIQ